MNVAEDLSGLSRAELVYKAKLAEQAERCVRAASRFHFGFSTVARPVAGGEQKRPSPARRGPDVRGSDRGSGEPSARPRSHGTTLVAFASPSPAAPRIEPRARLAGPDLARDHAVSSRVARIVNSNRDTSSSAAPGHELGGLPRGWRARPPRGCGEQPRPAASSRGAPPPPPGRLRPREAVAPSDPLDWARRAHQSTRTQPTRCGVVRRVFCFLFFVSFSRRRGRRTNGADLTLYCPTSSSLKKATTR